MNLPETAELQVHGRHDAHGGYALQLVGEVDLSSVPLVRAQVEDVLATPPARISVELSGVSFIDSSGIGVLLEVASAIPNIVLINPSPAVSRLVQLSGLSSILPITTAAPLPVTS